MNEASKTLLYYSELLLPYFEHSTVLDIGAGEDPVVPWAHVYDKAQGDAQNIALDSIPQYDVVFSSHCLEHMPDPRKAIIDWWSIVKVGGYLIFVVPDEDLYEQGVFPSLFNSDHKKTFTISKSNSWSMDSENVYDLATNLANSSIVYMKLQDDGYDRTKLVSRLQFSTMYSLAKRFPAPLSRPLVSIMNHLKFWPVDQTSLDDFRLAQILTIIRKDS